MDLSNFSYSHTYWIFLLPLVMIATDVVSGWIQATINSTWDSTHLTDSVSLLTKEGFEVRHEVFEHDAG